jgi:hypothetical protein
MRFGFVTQVDALMIPVMLEVFNTQMERLSFVAHHMLDGMSPTT